MKAFTSTLWQGDPEMLQMIKDTAKDFVEELIPHGR